MEKEVLCQSSLHITLIFQVQQMIPFNDPNLFLLGDVMIFIDDSHHL